MLLDVTSVVRVCVCRIRMIILRLIENLARSRIKHKWGTEKFKVQVQYYKIKF